MNIGTPIDVLSTMIARRPRFTAAVAVPCQEPRAKQPPGAERREQMLPDQHLVRRVKGRRRKRPMCFQGTARVSLDEGLARKLPRAAQHSRFCPNADDGIATAGRSAYSDCLG
jgi:hypothetical protein